MSGAHTEAVLSAAVRCGIDPDAKMRGLLAEFIEYLLAENEVMDLTAITDPEGVAVRHFADSWTLLPLLDEEAAKHKGAKPLTLLDVGSGAGFPGLAVKLVRPAIQVVLLDSQKKRVDFLARAVSRLGLEEIESVWGRAEVLARDPAFRDRFDMVTARAVASLPVLSELCLPFVRPGGLFIAMRAKAGNEPEKISQLCAVKEKVLELDLDGMERRLVVYRKEGPTEKRYPRAYAAILKKPLFLPD